MDSENEIIVDNLEDKKEEKQAPKKDNKPKAKAIAVKDSGVLMPSDHVQLMILIDQMIAAKAVPKHLDNRLKVLAAWNFAAQLGLPPQPSLRHVAVIEGIPQLFGDLPLSLAQAHKDYLWHEEFCIDPEYKPICFENKNLDAPIFGGVCIIKRKGMRNEKSFAFTVKDMEKAGLSRRAKPGMPWHSYDQVMYVRRARAMALKAHFADALCGAGIAEYDSHTAPDLENMRDVSQSVGAKEFIDNLE